MRRLFPTLIAALASACTVPGERVEYDKALKDKDYEGAARRLHFDHSAGHIVPTDPSPTSPEYKQAYAAEARQLIQRWSMSARKPETGDHFKALATLVRTAGFPAETVNQYALQAFEQYGAVAHRPNVRRVDAEDSNLDADEVADEFPGAIPPDQHGHLVTKLWLADPCCSGDIERFVRRHPLTPEIARGAYHLAIAKGAFMRATQLASGGMLTEAEYREARTKDLSRSFERALEPDGNLHDALAIAEDREARIEPTMIDRAFAVARQRGEYGFAIAFSRLGGRVTGEGDRRDAAKRLFEEQLQFEPVEAYRTALAHDLGPAYLERARKLAFQHAAETGQFALAQRLPDGVFMIIQD
ncbi:MAG: hypothetical protein Q7R80_01175 [bacterium]|nr:hypothetical protein [bacterium]